MIATTLGAVAASLVLATAALAQTAGAPPATVAATKPSGAVPAAAVPSAGAGTAPAAATPALPSGTVTPTLPGLDLKPDHMENGRWYNAEGIPVPNIQNGQVDYATFSGYRRYHAECHVCHGPDGEGSTYAPALKNSVVHRIDYYQYQQIIASGKQDVSNAANLVMPAFGTNRNVWCYVDDIYVYLLARGTEEIPRGRPADKAPKSDEFAAQETACMAG